MSAPHRTMSSQCPTVAKRIQLRHDTAAHWASVGTTLILLAGEFAYEIDTGKVKVGDGVSVWNALPYFASSATNGIFDGGDPFSTYVMEPSIDFGGVV